MTDATFWLILTELIVGIEDLVYRLITSSVTFLTTSSELIWLWILASSKVRSTSL